MCILKLVFCYLCWLIKKKIYLDLKYIKTIEWVKSINTPAFYLFTKGDIVSRPDWVLDLFYLHGGQ